MKIQDIRDKLIPVEYDGDTGVEKGYLFCGKYIGRWLGFISLEEFESNLRSLDGYEWNRISRRNVGVEILKVEDFDGIKVNDYPLVVSYIDTGYQRTRRRVAKC